MDWDRIARELHAAGWSPGASGLAALQAREWEREREERVEAWEEWVFAQHFGTSVLTYVAEQDARAPYAPVCESTYRQIPTEEAA